MSGPSAAGKRYVLIADDEPSMRLLVNATIASDQIGVIEAADGDEAWALILQHRPELVLLDVQMPGQTGLEVARRVREHPALTHTKIVMLTSKAQAMDIEAGLAAGADLYLTKPFSPISLLTYVEGALGL
ncbi:MAG: response regulator [Chloroflexi bacterium]|nr:response regulator [Chloroflexota bacterium]